MRKLRINSSYWREAFSGYLFLLPGALGFLTFVAYPVIYGLFLSITNSDGFNIPQIIGFANFEKAFSDKLVLKSLINNFKYTFSLVPLSAALSLLVAVLLHRGFKAANFFKTVLFFPYITAPIAIAIIWKQLFLPDKGLINSVLKAVGFQIVPGWLVASSTALISVIIVAVWHGFGFNMVIFLAGLQSIPYELYEAGMLDGATGWKSFKHITFPMLSPTIFFVTSMGIINSFRVFDLIFQMTLGGPGNATTVLVYRIYQEGIINMRFGYSSSIAYILFTIILFFTGLQFFLRDKWVFYGES